MGMVNLVGGAKASVCCGADPGLCGAGFKLGSTKAVNEAAKWKKVSHPNIVSLRELFTTKSFGDNCEGERGVRGRVQCERRVL